MTLLQIRKVPEVNEEFARSIRKDLTLEQLTMEVEKAVMEETGTTKVDARNRRVTCRSASFVLLLYIHRASFYPVSFHWLVSLCYFRPPFRSPR